MQEKTNPCGDAFPEHAVSAELFSSYKYAEHFFWGLGRVAESCPSRN